MAITKLLTIQTSKGDYSYRHLARAIPYACNPDKTRHGILTGAYNCLPETALKQMIMTKERFDKTDKRQGYHFIISFVKGEVAAEVAYQIIDEFVKEYLAERYEVVFGVHDDKEHIHGHVVCNSVSLVDGRKYHYANGDWKRNIQPIVNRLCAVNQLQTVDLTRPKQKRHKNYRVWANEKAGKVTHLSLMKEDVDYCIRKGGSYSEFISLLRQNGYEVKSGVHISIWLKENEKDKPRRLDTWFGKEYLPECIKKRIVTEQLPKEILTRTAPVIKPIKQFRYPRAKLTPFQKRYFCKLYRIGQMRKRHYSNAWKYRDDIVRLGELQEQFLYIWRNHIETAADLKEKEAELKSQYERLGEEREEIYWIRRDARKAFGLIEELHAAKGRAELFQAGEVIFEPDYERYAGITKALTALGMTVDEAESLRADTKQKLETISKERREIRKELSLCQQTKAENLTTVGRMQSREKKKERKR